MNEDNPFTKHMTETPVAIEAAIKAGKEVMDVYNQKFSSTLKIDNEPLTEADIKSNNIIQKIISQFGYPILSEESIDDKKRLASDKIWIVDPLDGTTDFVKQTGEFTIMISLVEGNRPILGVIYWPIKDTLYLAQKDQGAFQSSSGNWSKLSVSNVSELTSKGSSLKVVDVSSGNADLYFTMTNKIKQWDTCASYCLITEAGGKMTDMFGNDLEYNAEKLNHENGLLVSNGLIHNGVISIYRKFLSEN